MTETTITSLRIPRDLLAEIRQERFDSKAESVTQAMTEMLRESLDSRRAKRENGATIKAQVRPDLTSRSRVAYVAEIGDGRMVLLVADAQNRDVQTLMCAQLRADAAGLKAGDFIGFDGPAKSVERWHAGDWSKAFSDVEDITGMAKLMPAGERLFRLQAASAGTMMTYVGTRLGGDEDGVLQWG